MDTVNPGVLADRLKWRYAVKAFDPAKKIPDATWKLLEEALVLAPSSFGLQPWRFVEVQDTGVRAKLRAAAWNQGQVTDASHVVVIARKLVVTAADVDAYVDRTVAVRSAPREALQEYRQMMVNSVTNPQSLAGGAGMDAWTRSQCYIALGFFLSAAALLGVDACPMEGFDAKAFDEILGLTKEGYGATVMVTAGYRSPSDWLASLAKVRYEPATVIRRV